MKRKQIVILAWLGISCLALTQTTMSARVGADARTNGPRTQTVASQEDIEARAETRVNELLGEDDTGRKNRFIERAAGILHAGD